jgi:hypothetical protein
MHMPDLAFGPKGEELEEETQPGGNRGIQTGGMERLHSTSIPSLLDRRS